MANRIPRKKKKQLKKLFGINKSVMVVGKERFYIFSKKHYEVVKKQCFEDYKVEVNKLF